MQNNIEMVDFVKNLLINNLPEFYYFHSVNHTTYVMNKAELIARNENCSDYEINLLKTASLWHDVGYINIYKGHEEESCFLAKKHLPQYDYKDEEIDRICGMIMATKVPQSPTNLLEEIIADADLIYLGYPYAKEVANLLFKELSYINHTLTRGLWNEMQIRFLENHQYFTHYCQLNHEPQKQAYLQSLITFS